MAARIEDVCVRKEEKTIIEVAEYMKWHVVRLFLQNNLLYFLV